MRRKLATALRIILSIWRKFEIFDNLLLLFAVSAWSGGGVLYTLQLFPQFWQIAVFSELILVLDFPLDFPMISHSPKVQIMSAHRMIVHKHPRPLLRVDADVCTMLTLTFELPHRGQLIIPPILG